MWTRLLLILAVAACASKDDPEKSLFENQDKPGASAREPDRIVVDHILIGVRTNAFPNGRHSLASARKLAYDLKKQLDDGAEWQTLKSRYSEDPPPGGPYAMSNLGVRPRQGEYPRDQMVGAFGNVGFKLAVGEIGVADYDPGTSKYGFHIIKRVK